MAFFRPRRALIFERLGQRDQPSTIFVGNAIVPPNAESEIEIVALSEVGDPLIRTLNMRAQLGDGRGPGSEPAFKSVSYLETIWTNKETQVLGGVIETEPQFVQSTIFLLNDQDPSLAADGTIARLTIDTHGFTRGTFDVKLADTLFPPTDFGAVKPQIVNGTITIAGAGDANLDGRFTSDDLVHVFQIAEYEDDVAFNSTWQDGDWNDDGDFTSADLVAAFAASTYEQ